jgi:hypothetical protein
MAPVIRAHIGLPAVGAGLASAAAFPFAVALRAGRPDVDIDEPAVRGRRREKGFDLAHVIREGRGGQTVLSPSPVVLGYA